ncbi:MAG: glutamate formimidoyltransferase [bacterium]|nr:glutamate formimidoyltransferase [Candidatus Margulisiibacteriota bacterium]
MKKILECVPNFSEGSDKQIIDEIVSVVKTAKILDLHSDPDHNRSVVTIVGEPQEVKQAAFALTEKAVQLLDINEHFGEHPYLGVVDVIPFIPIRCPMSDVLCLAHELGQELWEKISLPVYFYGEAAKIPERRELPYVRKGGYESLREEIFEPHRIPDLGEGLHASAGVVAVGVRDFLIAFNVNLKTDNLDIAKSIAKSIREKSGGLAGVRALGIPLYSRGITQVSINVCDHRTTSLQAVFDEVKKWATEYQIEILESEIVGLVPEEAVFEGMVEHLKLVALPRVLS